MLRFWDTSRQVCLWWKELDIPSDEKDNDCSWNWGLFKVIIFHPTLDELSRQSGSAISTPYRRPPNVLVLQHVSNHNISPMTHSYCAGLWLPVLPWIHPHTSHQPHTHRLVSEGSSYEHVIFATEGRSDATLKTDRIAQIVKRVVWSAGTTSLSGKTSISNFKGLSLRESTDLRS